MRYRPYGNISGATVSALGFGCMRLPMKNENTIDREKAFPMLQKAYESGINYFDTGKWYCGQDSEKTLGEAVKMMDRSKIYLSTKYAGEADTADDLRQKFETSLKLMDQDYIDFYHFWGISWERFEKHLSVKDGPLSGALKLKEEGLIRNLSFSFHSDPSEIFKLVDTGYFATMLCQYNLLDRKNEAGIAYAAEKGLGVAIMGPVAGGRLDTPSEAVAKLIVGEEKVSSPELALRFVLSNPNVSVALSGMSTMDHVVENCQTASRESYLNAVERDNVVEAARKNQQFMDLYCTGCNYCMPCPQEVNIPLIFQQMNHYRIWDLKDHARNTYQQIGQVPWLKGVNAEACVQCGECETKCPQHIHIIDQLQECHEVLA